MRSISHKPKTVVEENCTKGEARLQFSGTRAAEKAAQQLLLLGEV
jgi:hypothetical protein